METERKRRREAQQVGESSGENSTAMGDGGDKRTTDLAMESKMPYGLEVSMEMEVLECPLCHLPLKPPIFQCCEGHCVCSSCRGELSASAGGKCRSCSAALSSTRCFAMERVVQSVGVPCLYAGHGCTKRMAYGDGEEEAHERACPHAPFLCPDSGCGFAGTPAALMEHFASRHKWPTASEPELSYGKINSGIRVQPGLQVLRGQGQGGGGRLFLVKTVEMERKTREEEEAQTQSRSSGKRRRRNVFVGPEVLRCPFCYEAFSTPIFQCGECHCPICPSCGDRGGGGGGEHLADKSVPCPCCSKNLHLKRCFALEQVLESVLVPRCRNAGHGCAERMLPFDKMEEHEVDCLYAPCYCPDRSSVSGCRFTGTVAMLRDHFTGHHRWPSTEFRYGDAFDLPVQPGYQVLCAQDDGRLFLVSMAPPSSPGTRFGYAVALVCVQPDSWGWDCKMECSVCFSYSEPGGHRQVLSRDLVETSELLQPPRDYSFVVPWRSKEGATGVVLRTTIQLREVEGEVSKTEGGTACNTAVKLGA